ncbi:MAG: site-specific integrase [Endomicrobium sp.]|jgi:site-specific recombinase XerC|nr:site-specific integrase [Endomicrobium sp.]
MASKLQKKNKKWTFRYLLDGKHKRYVCKSYAYQDAEQERIDFIHSLSAIKDKKNIEGMLWVDLCGKFVRYVKQYKKAPEAYERHLRCFNRIANIKYVIDVTTSKICDYMNARLSNGIKKSSINRELNSISSLFSWAVNIEGYRIDNPVKNIPKFKIKSVVKTRVLMPLEIQKMFTCLNDKIDTNGNIWDMDEKQRDMLQGLLYLALYADLRLKEGKTMLREQVLFNENSILVEPQKTSETNPNVKRIPLATKLKRFLTAIFNKYPNDIYVVPNIDEKQTLRTQVLYI